MELQKRSFQTGLRQIISSARGWAKSWHVGPHKKKTEWCFEGCTQPQCLHSQWSMYIKLCRKKPNLQIVWFSFTSVALNIKLMVRSQSAMSYLLRKDSKMPRTASTSTGEDKSFTQWFHWALRHKRDTCQYILYVCVCMFMSLWWTETQTQSAVSVSEFLFQH